MKYTNRQYMEILFDEGDLVCVGDLYESAVEEMYCTTDGEFLCINALSNVDHEYLKKPHYNYEVPRRADANVRTFRNFMFEIDTLGIQEQMLIFKGCGIEWSASVYSGSKSIHHILSLDLPLTDVDHYKQVWKRLAAKINNYSDELGYGNKVIDESGKNPSRFTRFPEHSPAETSRARQVIMSLGKRMEFNTFNILMNTCPEIAIPTFNVPVDISVSDELEFFDQCPKGLAYTIKYPRNLSDSGWYHEIYKMTLWVIDSTGASFELTEQIYNKYIFKQLLAAGYPEYKISMGLVDAYKTKGLV